MKQKLNNITVLLVLVLMTLPNLGQLIFGLPTGTKQLVRRFERCSFKSIRAKCGQTFNSMCIREGLLPKYSNIKLHDASADNEPFTLEFRRSLIQRELTNASQKIHELEEEKAQILVTLQNDVPPDDLSKILKVVEDIIIFS